MNFNIVNKNDEMVMALIHYFITEENYTPIVVRGTKDEIWLENLDAPYRIIRINSNHIHNDEQYQFDLFKTEKVMEQIRKKTLSFNMNALNIFLNVSDDVTLEDNSKNMSSLKLDEIKEITKNKNIVELFPKIKSKLIQDKEGLDLIVNVTNDINAKTIQENESYAKVFEPRKPIVTYILIGICVIVFALMYILGNGSENVATLVNFGANSYELVKNGEVWRVITSIFLHIGIIHLFANMYALYVIGRQLEGFLGKIKYSIVFLGSGIVGSMLSIVINQGSISAGASGAIFGLLGSLLYFGYHYRLYLGSVMRSQIIPVIVVNLLIGFLLPGIDVFAHIGGLAAGYLLTMALGIPGKGKKQDRINGSIVFVLLVGFLIFMLVRY